ncbi:MAG: enoyl-CoA hydratase/isomerase family protein [Thermoleophilaceae bacterium]
MVSVQTEGDVAVVRIDRPPANAMDLELLAAGHAALSEVEDAGAVVLTGREGFFSAGVDLKLAPTLDAGGQREMVEGINRLFAGWYALPRPLVCAVNGHAIAGGLIMALCGDLRVGVDAGAKLGLTELKAGIPYPAVALAVTRAELTPAAVRLLALRAHLVEPPEALRLGVLDELAPAPALLDTAIERAGELAALPRAAYETVKRQVRGPAIEAMDRLLEGGDDPMLGAWLGDEAAAASRAILERG